MLVERQMSDLYKKAHVYGQSICRAQLLRRLYVARHWSCL